MKTDIELKNLIDEYNVLPKSRQRTRIGKVIRREKKKLVEDYNYVGIIYITQSMGDYEKDRLFLDLLKRHPDSSLFVLAFANSEMHSYDCAYKMENLDHDNDVEALRKDIELTFDSILCKFLSEHGTKSDFNFVQDLTDGATWLESYKRALHGLSQLWFSGTGSLSFGSIFFNFKNRPNLIGLPYLDFKLFY